MENSNNKSLQTEISTIRSILMGQEMESYESRFKRIQEQFEALSKQLEEVDQAARMANDQTKQELSEDLDKKFSSLDQLLKANVQTLHETIEQKSVSDKEQIGKLLMELGQQLVSKP